MSQEIIDNDGEIRIGYDEPKQPIFLRTPYNYNMDKASHDTGLHCPEPTLAQQQFKEETDINTIIERFGVTGTVPTNVRTPLPEDFQSITNYHEAANQILAAQAAFMQMPANIRARFNNDPGSFLDFTNNPENKDEARKLGILREEQPALQEPPVIKTETPPAEK